MLAIFLLVILFFAGPGPKRFAPEDIAFDAIKADPDTMDQYISDLESRFDIKDDNHARIFWYDTTDRERTEYVLLYLHGFSASWKEGDPTHRDLARRYGMNLYAPRLAGHGLADESLFRNLTAMEFYQSAVEALEIAHTLGEKVIIMSTSTGGTLSLLLAYFFPEKVEALIMYSPNLEVYGPTKIFRWPWSIQLGTLVNGFSPYHSWEPVSGQEEQYWYTRYHLNGISVLRQLLDYVNREKLLSAITTPAFVGYYYKNASEQDDIVKVSEIKEMLEAIGTDRDSLTAVEFQNVGHHVIASPIRSEDVPFVKIRTYQFAELVLALQPIFK